MASDQRLLIRAHLLFSLPLMLSPPLLIPSSPFLLVFRLMASGVVKETEILEDHSHRKAADPPDLQALSVPKGDGFLHV